MKTKLPLSTRLSATFVLCATLPASAGSVLDLPQGTPITDVPYVTVSGGGPNGVFTVDASDWTAVSMFGHVGDNEDGSFLTGTFHLSLTFVDGVAVSGSILEEVDYGFGLGLETLFQSDHLLAADVPVDNMYRFAFRQDTQGVFRQPDNSLDGSLTRGPRASSKDARLAALDLIDDAGDGTADVQSEPGNPTPGRRPPGDTVFIDPGMIIGGEVWLHAFGFPNDPRDSEVKTWANPAAVPTPTAAHAGLTLLACVGGFEVIRRLRGSRHIKGAD